MSHILGLDVGEKRIGMAIADEKLKVVFPRETISYKRQVVLLEFLKTFCEEVGISRIVIGLPLDAKEKETKQSSKIRVFAKKLSRHVNLPIEFQEESYSTQEGIWKMPKYRKEHRDALAAMVILERYLAL